MDQSSLHKPTLHHDVPHESGASDPAAFLDRWQSSQNVDPDAASQIVSDLIRRRDREDQPTRRTSVDPFPEVRSSDGGIYGRVRLPKVGEQVFGFSLMGELGRGAFARVFLAQQRQLADRPVALKVSAREGHEPQTLAHLQHANIVPIYSVHDDPASGLRAVCMPFFAGAALSAVLQEMWRSGAYASSGRDFVDALAQVQTQPTAAASDGSAPRDTIARLPIFRAIAWIVACLADGLQHAHDRGIYHRDIKPSNILIGGDGQPMLLDFNLSHDARLDPTPALPGGTVTYMSPEHLRALHSRDRELFKFVDHRSDLYSLGVVLFEMVAGRSPFNTNGNDSLHPDRIAEMADERASRTPSLRQIKVDVPWTLESIVRKCMAPNPDQRYQRADELADDLRRFIDDRPLRFAPELSLVERGQKWSRRHPKLTTMIAITVVVAAVLAGTGSALYSTWGKLRGSESQVAPPDAEVD